jgi:hypothetical protein
MKTSRRLLLGTFLTLLAVPVVLVAYSRFGFDPASRERPLPERTSPAELVALRDFTAIEIRGDVNLEVTGAADYSIAYTPLSERRGNLEARVEDRTLIIEAFGNRNDTTAASLQIGLPELERLDGEFLAALTIRNFDSDMLELRLTTASEVLLENNRIASLQAELGYVANVEFRGNTIGASEITHFGITIRSD